MKCLLEIYGVYDVPVQLYPLKQNLGLWMSQTRSTGSFQVSHSLQNRARNDECPTSEVVLMVAFPVSELYFLIAKFLSGGPLKETAKVNRVKLCVNNIYLSTNVVILTFSVADFAKRARERRGKSELFLVPGSKLLLFWSRTHVVATVKVAETLLKSFYSGRMSAGSASTPRLGGQRAPPILR